MSNPLRGRSRWGSILFGYLLFAVVAARAIFAYVAEAGFPVVLGLLGGMLVLSATEPLLSPRFAWYRYFYFPVQTGLVLALGLQQPYTDFWGLLYALLCIEAARSLRRPTLIACGLLWAAILTVTTSLTKAWPDGLAVALSIDAGGLFVLSYGILSEQQEQARQESQALLQRLQVAHARLQEYAGQAEEMAAADERNRLAHELRDSVNQLLFAITLAASSARLLMERDPARVPAQLDELQDLTNRALQTMRTLITQLRPQADA